MGILVGNKLLCKQKFLSLKKGESYEIVYDDGTVCEVENGNIDGKRKVYIFCYDKIQGKDWANYIWKYFHTNQEVRKLKLERLQYV